MALQAKGDEVAAALRDKLASILVLVKDLRDLDDTEVLLGDHAIKLVRQSYFANKQHQVRSVQCSV